MQSDGIALAFGVLGILAAVRAPVAWAPWLAGALLGAGVAVKSLHVLPCVIVVGAVLLSQRRWAGLASLAIPLQLGLNPVVDTQQPDGLDTRVIEILDALPAETLVVTDDPGLAWQAHRGVPPGLADPSYARIAAGYLTADDLVTALRHPEVCAYVDWSGRFRPFARDVDVVVDGWRLELSDGRGGRLLVRPGCAVPAATAGGS